MGSSKLSFLVVALLWTGTSYSQNSAPLLASQTQSELTEAQEFTASPMNNGAIQFRDYLTTATELFDRDKDGVLSGEEVDALIESVEAGSFSPVPRIPIPDGDLPPPLKPYDTNNDGRISQQEYRRLQHDALTGKLPPPRRDRSSSAYARMDGSPPPEELQKFTELQQQMFDRFDLDQNRFIDDQELVRFREAVRSGQFKITLQAPPTEGPLPERIAIYDLNKDGVIDDAEASALQIDALALRFVPTEGPDSNNLETNTSGGGGLIGSGGSAEAQLRPERQALIDPDRIVSALDIQTGQVVVDIGAGHGFFSVPLARAVGEKGTVFATDIDAAALSLIREQAQELGLPQITPVQVAPVGLDPFYRQHKFDVIFMCDVLQSIQGRAAYLDELRSSLKANGTLWILMIKLDADFSVAEFKNLSAIRTALSRSPYLALVKSRLQADTQRLLEGAEATDPLNGLARFVEDINQILNDRSFAEAVQDMGALANASLAQSEQGVRDYLFESQNKLKDIPGKAALASSQLRLLNRLVLVNILGTNVWQRAFAIEDANMSDWQRLIPSMELDPKLPEFLKSVGFELVEEHAILPSYRIFELRVADR